MNNVKHAYPHQPVDPAGRASAPFDGGMTLRDHFAGLVLSDCFQYSFEARKSLPISVEKAQKQIAEACYDMADAMLAQREKG